MASVMSSMQRMSDELYDFTCTRCERNNQIIKEAVKYCVDCSEYCCQACTDLHQTFSELRRHTLLGSSQGNQSGNQHRRLPEFPTERCGIHNEKVLDHYCKAHDDVGCSICIKENHRLCPGNQIYCVPEMIDTLFNSTESTTIKHRLTRVKASMLAANKSVDDHVKTIKVMQCKAIDDITNFQNVLIQILNKAAGTSKQKVIDACNKLEHSLLQQRQNIIDTNEILHKTEVKMYKAEENRAQLFSCTKLAKSIINDAETERIKQEIDKYANVRVLFSPNKSLVGLVSAVKSIGEVNYTYTVKERGSLNVKVPDDPEVSNCTGFCLTNDDKLLVTDMRNKKLKRVDIREGKCVDYCTINGDIRDVCCISEQEATVTCGENKKIQFVSIGKKMKCTRQIKTTHDCAGITTKGDKLYVTDCGPSVYVYSLSGELLKTIPHVSTGSTLFTRSRYVAFNKSGDKMYVNDLDAGIVCLDGSGRFISTFNDVELTGARGVCSDDKGNVFVCGIDSHNVVQFNENGKKIGVILKHQDGLEHPRSACFHQCLSRLFITLANSDMIQWLDLE